MVFYPILEKIENFTKLSIRKSTENPMVTRSVTSAITSKNGQISQTFTFYLLQEFPMNIRIVV